VAFASVRRLLIVFAGRGTLVSISSRWMAWAGHDLMRFRTVSSSSPHAGQIGDGAFWMRWRCLLSGAWPVRSRRSRLVCLRVSSLASIKNLLDGSESSISLVFAYRGDLAQIRFALSWRNLLTRQVVAVTKRILDAPLVNESANNKGSSCSVTA
jgi:hypothetical protein